MKTNIENTKSNRGMALIITVILVAFAALYFITYLVLTANEYKAVARSQTWNDALTVAEAGMEEGLALVNKNAYDTVSVTNWWLTATNDGWANIANITAGSNTFQVFSISRTLPNASGSYSGSYTVYVTNVIANGNTFGIPTILSIGTVQNESVPTVSRSILVKTSAVSITGSSGVIAQDGVTTSGGVTIDSWDSSSSLHSIWQSNYLYRANYFSSGTPYGLWSNSLSFVSNSYPSRTAQVYVFTDTNFITMSGNATVAGYLETGPGGAETMSGNSTVGDLAWCFGPTGTGGGSTGVEPGHYDEDANLNFHSKQLPIPTNSWQTTWTNIPSPANGSAIKIGGIWWFTNNVWTNIGGAYYTNTGSGFNIRGVTYGLVITNRLQNTNYVYYSANSLSQSLFVDAQYVVLYLTNGWSYSGQTTFTLNTNADIQVWTTGNISVSGQAVINNYGNYTHAFSIFDVAGHPISVSLTGNGAATGSYYLPSSTLGFSGGGNSGDFVGAVVCYTINDSGHMNIHFDQSLGGPTTTPDQFTPASWTEVTTQ
ncbi:MAG TPA: hypothetical protein VMO20_06755 [Candidatus Acidoferrum sp.]|nr:hypothetical protein [Candidatus Acidoferrum sp.]